MPRYHLIIEYDGKPFVGWQRQSNGWSVQEAIERAAENFCGHAVTTVAAGRTDAGVHALGMSVHIDFETQYEDYVVKNAINYHLKPNLVTVLQCASVTDDFHARFSCCRRNYEYRLLNRKARPVLDAGRVWHIAAQLDLPLMQSASKFFVGKHDFTTFRAAACQANSPVKTLEFSQVEKRGDYVDLRFSAPSFLHNQVRSMVGTLVDIGKRRYPPTYVQEALAARDRTACGQVAPAHGLYFVSAAYDAVR